MTDERTTIPGENTSFDRDGVAYQEKISNKNQMDGPIYIEDQYDVAKLSAAGDQAKVETVIDEDLAKLEEIKPKDELDIGSQEVPSMANSDGEEVLIEDHSSMDDSGLTEDDIDDDSGNDFGNLNEPNINIPYNDPSSLMVIGRGLRLHTPPRDGPVVKKEGDQRLPPEGEEENAANIDTTPPSGEDISLDTDVLTSPPSITHDIKRSGSSRRPTLSPVIEEDVREYMRTWSYEDDNDHDHDHDLQIEGEDDADCGAGDATASVVESIIAGGSDDDYAKEVSRVLSSAAVDAALAEIDYEQNVQSKNTLTGYSEELDDSCDDIIIILPEAHELNYHNVPVGSSLEDSLQDATNARAQLDAQADFLENSLNCLEITLDRMSLNEAVMPDGSVVFLRDQLRKAKTGHLLRAWEKAKEAQDQYLSCAEMEKPLAQIQRELYQDQIKSFNSANEEMRTAVTQATLQEQALRGQARQVQQTYNGLEQNIANLSHELVGLQARQQQLQNALMEERIAKEAAQRENERISRRSSSDIIQPNSDILRDNRGVRRALQPEWISDQSASTSSEDIPTSGPLTQDGGQRWWSQRCQRDYEYIQPPPWRRGYRSTGGRRYGFGQRPGWRNNHDNWRLSETREGQRPWERRRPPHAYRPFVNRPRPPLPPPAPFTPPFKKETEVILTQYFHEMGRVENLLRERGFAKGPAADAPVIPYRPRHMRYQRYSGGSRQGGWERRREELGSRSVPSMGGAGLPYRERSQRNTDWFDTSRSQTSNQVNQRLSEEAMSISVGVQATASA